MTVCTNPVLNDCVCCKLVLLTFLIISCLLLHCFLMLLCKVTVPKIKCIIINVNNHKMPHFIPEVFETLRVSCCNIYNVSIH